MKPIASVGRFLLVLFALGATAAVGGSLLAARAATPNVSSNRAAIPPGLLAAVTRSEAAAAAHAQRYRLDAHGCARLPATALGACFGAHGARINDGGAQPLVLTLTGWGRAGAIRRVHLVRTAPRGNRIDYRGTDLRESWQALPLGFEQTFVLTQPPAGFARAGGRIVLRLRASQAPQRIGDSLAWGRLRYGGLAVRDAAGHAVPAILSAHGRRIEISLRAAHARWPLTVDPLVWLQQEVTASDGAAGDKFGWSVALSGTTAVIGAPNKTINGNFDQGAAYMFTESSSGIWTQQAKLVAADGAAFNYFGVSVALSPSGTTVLIGAPYKTIGSNSFQGAAYVYTKSGGTWSQQAELTAANGAANDNFGQSVAISGTTAVIGAPSGGSSYHQGQGVAYAYTESGGTWSQQAELVATNGAAYDNFGNSVAISGTTAIVGALDKAINGNPYQGAAYVFTESGGTWSQQAELTAADGAANDYFGISVALSGTTAVIGAEYKTIGSNTYQGAAYVYTESGGTWSQQAELVATNGAANDYFGTSVALSGTTAVVSAYGKTVGSNTYQGAAYVYTESGGTWSQQAELVAANGMANDYFGQSVALSGTTAVVGAVNKTIGSNAAQGAAYFFSASNLANVLNAPASVTASTQFTSKYILTNSSVTASAAAVAYLPVPAGATYVTATASQGGCSYDSTALAATCALGAIAGNGGTASASLTLRATAAGTTLAESAAVSNATPPLSAAAAITIGTLPPPPTISGLTNLTVAAGQSGTETFTLAGTGTLTLTATSSDTTLLPATGITGAGSCTAAGSCTLTLTPATGQSGTATVTIAVADAYSQSATGTFTFTVNSASPPPSGGGGGALGFLALLALMGLAVPVTLCRRRTRG